MVKTVNLAALMKFLAHLSPERGIPAYQALARAGCPKGCRWRSRASGAAVGRRYQEKNVSVRSHAPRAATGRASSKSPGSGLSQPFAIQNRCFFGRRVHLTLDLVGRRDPCKRLLHDR